MNSPPQQISYMYENWMENDFFRLFVFCSSFSLLRLILPLVTSQPECIKTSLKSIDRWRWFNIMVSFCHSCMSSVWCLLCFYNEPHLINDIINHYSYFSHSLVLFSTGYFLYDAIDYFFGLPFAKSWDILLHHVVVIVCFGVSVASHKYISYVILALLVEVNSIFLHLRQMMRMSNIDTSSNLYKFVSFGTLTSFVIFRIAPLLYMTYWLSQHYTDIILPLSMLGGIGMLVMNVMNVILFIRILKKDFLNPTKNIVLANNGFHSNSHCNSSEKKIKTT